MTRVLLPLLRQAAAPFDVRVTGSGPDVLLIPGLASSGAVWDATVAQLCATHRCHFIMLDDPAWFEKTLEAFLE